MIAWKILTSTGQSIWNVCLPNFVQSWPRKTPFFCPIHFLRQFGLTSWLLYLRSACCWLVTIQYPSLSLGSWLEMQIQQDRGFLTVVRNCPSVGTSYVCITYKCTAAGTETAKGCQVPAEVLPERIQFPKNSNSKSTESSVHTHDWIRSTSTVQRLLVAQNSNAALIFSRSHCLHHEFVRQEQC